MKLIVGLGNPGPKYLNTRHNIGFLVVDAMAQEESLDFKAEHFALTKKITLEQQPCLLVKPQTFMNLSGQSVRALMDYYKINLEDLLVIHDEVDLPFQQLRFQIRRGHGGHNGIRNVHQVLGTDNYARLKLGVGRPTHPSQEVANYVLESFSKSEFNELPDFIGLAAEAVVFFIENGIEKAANKFNGERQGS